MTKPIRGTNRLPILLLLAVAGFPLDATAEDEDRTEKRGKHFRVVLDFESQRAAEEALASVEALWPHAAAFYGLEDDEFDGPLDVHLYRDRRGYEKACDRLVKGNFKRNMAFAHWESQSAHVALQPEVSDDVLAAEGLPYLTRLMLVHEAAHAVRYAHMPNRTAHPPWFGDGAALWLKFETMKSLGLITTEEEDPNACADMGRVRDLVKRERLPTVEEILADGLDDLSFYERYSVKYVFFRWLAEPDRRDALRTVRKKIRRMGLGRDFPARVKAALEEALGEKRWAGRDDAFRAYVKALKPGWNEVFRTLETGGEAWTQIAFAGNNAIAWRTEPVGAAAYVLETTVTILPNYGKQMNLLLDKRDAGFVSIALLAGFGVTVFEYYAKDSRWMNRGSGKVAGLSIGTPFDVCVRVDGEKLGVEIDGALVYEGTLKGRGNLVGPWGLGAQARTAGTWTPVSVNKTK